MNATAIIIIAIMVMKTTMNSKYTFIDRILCSGYQTVMPSALLNHLSLKAFIQILIDNSQNFSNIKYHNNS
jgi:hypothetical protein